MRDNRETPSRVHVHMAANRSRRLMGVVAVAALSAATLAGCTATAQLTGRTTHTTAAATPTSPAPLPPATLTANPVTGTSTANPAVPVTMTARGGTLGAVTLTGADGKAIPGAVAAGGLTWTSRQPLVYGSSYTLTASARNADGVTSQAISHFTTLTPGNMTMPYLRTTGGSSLSDDDVYGVGIVPVVHFDEKVTDRAAAERALVVTTSPKLAGSWYWTDDQNVHYRPTVPDGSYWPSGTHVTVAANLFGVQVGPGLYGQANTSTSFTIGAKHVSIADDNTHQVSVYFNDVLQRKMPTSMGKGGYTTGSEGQNISFFTPSGTYTVIGKASSVIMDSSTYGLPVDAPGGYREEIPWATRISTDGIFLHQLNSTLYAQGRYDTSHGCLNLNYDNAYWFQQNALIGDVVTVEHTGGAPLQQWQNGDWTLTAAQWAKGSALG